MWCFPVTQLSHPDEDCASQKSHLKGHGLTSQQKNVLSSRKDRLLGPNQTRSEHFLYRVAHSTAVFYQQWAFHTGCILRANQVLDGLSVFWYWCSALNALQHKTTSGHSTLSNQITWDTFLLQCDNKGSKKQQSEEKLAAVSELKPHDIKLVIIMMWTINSSR